MTKYRLRLFFSLFLVPALVGTASAQTPDAVVEKYLAALGGREALGKLTSRRATGIVTVSTPAGDISGPIEIDTKAPNKTRVLMTLDLSAMGAGQMVIEQRFDGTSGFAMNSVQGDTEITGNQLENMRNNLFPTPLLKYKELQQSAGLKIELLPSEKIDSKDAIVLLVTPKTGSAIRMFLDQETSLVMRIVTTVNMPQFGGPLEQVSNLSDYRTVDGVKVPFKVVNSNPLQTLTIALTKVEHNVALDDAIFAKK